MVPKELVERFNAKWKKDASGCWMWTASVDGGGYGQIKLPKQRRQIKASRLSYMIHKGEIPPGVVVCHTCDVRLCVNPEHLFLGSKKDNSLDMVAKGRHLFGERQGAHKLTEGNVKRILELLDQGRSQVSIAEEIGISQMQVSRIKRGQRWGHLVPNPKPAMVKHKPLTPNEIRQVKEMLAAKVPGVKIAQAFGVAVSTITRIKTGRRWASIT